ncbi:hypothetical protein GCM10020367_45280 [Streptomyces sannanensis]|uniref:Hydrogenase expression protein HypF n=1 Tax=Streptomyces sannanensis TaxID=285536 RepID=A0ABP6SFZ1_9ACTN
MRGDDTQLTAAGGDGSRERTGPRHAAPKKSLLTKVRIPAGKAMALAAMPTAVFVGMGLTPRLAIADDGEIPFAPGPCVTRSDEPVSPSPSESASKDEDDKADEDKPSAEASETPSPQASGTADEREPAPGASPSADAGRPDADGTTAPKAADPAPEPTPTGTPDRGTDPLDPLGVGDALGDLLGVSEEEKAPPSTAPSAPTAPAKPAGKPAEAPAGKPATKPATGSRTDAAEDETDRTADAIRDAAEKAGAKVEELPEEAKGTDPVKDEDIPDGAKPHFPCPTADPEALAAAELETGIPRLPDEPWKLETTMLTLSGLRYHGIVEVKTYSGKIKKVLKFTATSVDIKDLHQLVVGPDGTTAHVTSDKGSTSTIRNGTVTMYTEELKGNLFGLIPVTFSPQTPPPLDVPFAFFTDCKVTQAGQFGGTLTVPGLKNFFTGGGN